MFGNNGRATRHWHTSDHVLQPRRSALVAAQSLEALHRLETHFRQQEFEKPGYDPFVQIRIVQLGTDWKNGSNGKYEL